MIFSEAGSQGKSWESAFWIEEKKLKKGIQLIQGRISLFLHSWFDLLLFSPECHLQYGHDSCVLDEW